MKKFVKVFTSIGLLMLAVVISVIPFALDEMCDNNWYWLLHLITFPLSLVVGIYALEHFSLEAKKENTIISFKEILKKEDINELNKFTKNER